VAKRDCMWDIERVYFGLEKNRSTLSFWTTFRPFHPWRMTRMTSQMKLNPHMRKVSFFLVIIIDYNAEFLLEKPRAASLGEDVVGQVIALALEACGTDSKVFPALV